MVKKFGKKTLLLFVLILAIVVTTLGVATAESVVEELVLESDSEVVVYRNKTVAGNDNTIGTTFTPVVKAKINGAWVYLDNGDISWSHTGGEAATVPELRSNGDLVQRGAWGYPCHGVNVITGTYEGLTVTYDAYQAVPVSTKEDMEALARKEYGNGTEFEGTGYTYSYRYALTNDIDYSSEVWAERYLQPISQNGSYAKSTGIWGENVGNQTGTYALFGASFDGCGYTIKNAVLPLLSYTAVDGDYGRYVPYFQNVIGFLYGGEFKNVKFEGLVFENKEQAIASSFYTVAGNPNLSFLADTDSDGAEDNRGFPVISDNGVVSAIDVATIAEVKVGNFFVTAGNFCGLVGYGVSVNISNVYVDATMHTSAGWYSPASRQRASAIIIANVQNDAAYAGSALLGSTRNSKISSCIVNARLSDSTILHVDAYTMRGPGAIIGCDDGNGYSNLVENCAILIEKGCNFDSMGTYHGLNAYPFYYNMGAYSTTGLSNVKVIEGTASESAMSKFLADSAYDLDMFDGLWNMAEINTTVFKGTYDGQENSVVVFGNVDTSLFDAAEIGVRAIRNGKDWEDLKDGDCYEFKFEGELRADGMFGIALKDLANGDYRAYVYVKLADGTEVVSDLITFNQTK